jgi:hypothetical protein
MPAVPRTTHRIQRQFVPLILRVHLPAEQLLTPPPLPWHTIFEAEAEGFPNVPQEPLIEAPPSDLELSNAATPSTSVTQPSASNESINKPAGEAGRKKNGYQLKVALGWDEQTYLDVQVSPQYRMIE